MAGRNDHRMNEPSDALIDEMAAALGIPLRPDWRAGVRANLIISLRLAGVVGEVALEDEADLAPVFRA